MSPTAAFCDAGVLEDSRTKRADTGVVRTCRQKRGGKQQGGDTIWDFGISVAVRQSMHAELSSGTPAVPVEALGLFLELVLPLVLKAQPTIA
jgi:hypothetical protein